MANRYYHGTRSVLASGDVITPAVSSSAFVLLTVNLDEATWSAELAAGEGAARVYAVEPLGTVAPLPDATSTPGHPSMSCCTREGFRVVSEVTEWPYYHGTRADLRAGELLEAGRVSNFGPSPRTAGHVYFTRTLDAAIWGAELAAGEARGRIYIVEPTGPFEDDPNLTNKRFRGNPTKSFRSREPLRVIGEVTEWTGHAPEVVQAMKDGLARLNKLGVEADD